MHRSTTPRCDRGGAAVELREAGRTSACSRHAAVLTGVALLGVISACGQGGASGAGVPTASRVGTPTSTPTPSPTPEAVTLPAPAACAVPVTTASPRVAPLPASAVAANAVIATVSTPYSPQGFAVGFGSVWVMTHRSSDVYRINPATNQAVDIKYTTDLPDANAFSLAAGPHGVWLVVGQEDALDRIDTTTNSLAPFAQIKGAEWVVDTPDGLWVASTDAKAQAVSQVDPTSGKVLRSVVVGAGSTNPDSSQVFLSYGAGSLWVTRQDDPMALIRMDPVSARLTAVVALPAANLGAVASASAVYVPMDDNSIARVDPATNCVTAVTSIGPPSSNRNVPIFIPIDPEGGVVRITYGTGAVAVLDATTLAVLKTFRVDTQQYEGGLVAAFGSLWFSTFNKDTVVRLRP